MVYRFDLNKRFYKLVAANSSEFYDYIPNIGETVFLVNAGVSSSAAPQTAALIVWDVIGTPEILMSTYAETSQTNLNKTLIGDGVKILRISLVNDLSESVHMGGYWQGEQI